MQSLKSRHSDILRPTFSQSVRISTYSWASWSGLVISAHLASSLPSSCSEIRTLLNNTPSIPSASDVPDAVEGYLLVLEGHSKWSVSDKSSYDECDLKATKDAYPRSAYIGVPRTSLCQLSDGYMSEWPGFEGMSQSSGNHLCACVLGWSYVFSARLIELRRVTPNDSVTYTDNMAQWSTDGPASSGLFELPLEHVEPAEARWWAAILAGGSGWRATLYRDGKEYSAPWACHLAKHSFILGLGTVMSSSAFPSCKPPLISRGSSVSLQLCTAI